jgi:hypothetical protein
MKQYSSRYVPVRENGLWLKSDGTETEVSPGNNRTHFLMEEIHHYLQTTLCHVISVPGRGKLYVRPSWQWVNQEPNFKATELANKTKVCVVPVGGNALLVNLE